MAQSMHRRSGLLDLMILIAGVAFGIWIVQEGTVPVFRRVIEVLLRLGWSRMTAIWIAMFLTTVQPIVAVWTLTLLTLAYRRRPSTRQLTIRPGPSACLAATLAMLIVVPLSSTMSRINLASGLPISVRLQAYLGHALTFQRAECGVAVATTWLALILGRRWRPRPEALDRAGCLLGIYWIATIPSTWLQSSG